MILTLLWLTLGGINIAPSGFNIINLSSLSFIFLSFIIIACGLIYNYNNRIKLLNIRDYTPSFKIYLIGLVAYLLSNLWHTPLSFNNNQYIFVVFLLSIPSYFLIEIIFEKYTSVAVFFLGIILSCYSFILKAKGRILFGDDHAAFFYRIIQLKEHFPNIPFYNFFWNSGVDAREFFPSGLLNVYLLFFPLINFLPIEVSYNYLILTILLLVTPACTFFAGKYLSFSSDACWIAAFFSLCATILLAKWALVFGTLGFLLSAALFPLNFALTVYILEGTKTKYATLILCIISVSLMLMWSPAIFAFAPLIIFFYI